jgi:Ca2+-binding EF-hand superfamily protein
MRLFILTAAAVAVLGCAGAASAQMPAPADMIKKWDTNGDGAVSKEEWAAAGRPADHFDMVDTNKDGKITVEELTTAIEKMKQQQGAH